MAKIPTVKIVDPGNPHDYVVINESDFNSALHELYEEDAPKASKSKSAPKGEEKKADDGSSLPDGYSVEHVAGGYYYLFGPEGQLIEGPSNGKWQGVDAAAQAAADHAVHAAGAGDSDEDEKE